MPAPDNGWSWAGDANVFFGYNYQQRLYLDETAWESQNWLMGSGTRHLGGGRLELSAMMSLEPFTMHAQGSPQLFQTGETYQGVSLVNYQHPHDLFMELGGTYRWTPPGRTQYFVGAYAVGSPTLGPTAFMHRESARDNPQAPLAHHVMDSTHISYGVVRGGVDVGAFTLEASAFRGAEPDEDRVGLEAPALDSWAARVQWNRGPWHAQFSGGHMHEPEFVEPWDVTRITASLSFDGEVKARPLHVTLAYGADHEFNGYNGNHDGYLGEWDTRLSRWATLYGRAEWVDKEPFSHRRDPPGLQHPHYYFKVGALTMGYVQELMQRRWGRVGIGADATVYHMPALYQLFWDGSHSYHVFLRWRPAMPSGHMGMKMN